MSQGMPKMTTVAKRPRIARGSRRARDKGMVRIVVAMDPDTWDQIAARVARRGCSTAEELRTLIEWGLEADDTTAQGTS